MPKVITGELKLEGFHNEYEEFQTVAYMRSINGRLCAKDLHICAKKNRAIAHMRIRIIRLCESAWKLQLELENTPKRHADSAGRRTQSGQVREEAFPHSVPYILPHNLGPFTPAAWDSLFWTFICLETIVFECETYTSIQLRAPRQRRQAAVSLRSTVNSGASKHAHKNKLGARAA